MPKENTLLKYCITTTEQKGLLKSRGVATSMVKFTTRSSVNRMLWSKPDSLFFFFFSSFILVEWIAAVSLAAGAAAVGYLAYKKFLCKDKCCKAMVNLHIQKDNPKVVHAFDMEDLGDKAVYCRCWRSKKVRISGPVAFMCMHLSIKLFSNCFI